MSKVKKKKYEDATISFYNFSSDPRKKCQSSSAALWNKIKASLNTFLIAIYTLVGSLSLKGSLFWTIDRKNGCSYHLDSKG